MDIYEKRNDSITQSYLAAISTGIDSETDLLNLNEILDKKQTEIDKQKKSINFGKMTTGLSIALIVILSLFVIFD